MKKVTYYLLPAVIFVLFVLSSYVNGAEAKTCGRDKSGVCTYFTNAVELQDCPADSDPIGLEQDECDPLPEGTTGYMCCKKRPAGSAKACGPTDEGACKSSTNATVTCDANQTKINFGVPGECGTESGKYYVCCKSGSSTPPANDKAITFENPLAFKTVEGLLSSVMTGFQAIVVLFTMIFFVWGATGYIMSAGNEEKMKGAKNGMTAALIGMALGIAAPSLLKTIGMILGWGDSKMCASITDPLALANCQKTFAEAPTTAQIGLNILEFLLGMVGTLGLIMLIIGGIMYFGSAADEKNVESAKKTIKYAIMGIALALASMVIVRQIAALLT